VMRLVSLGEEVVDEAGQDPPLAVVAEAAVPHRDVVAEDRPHASAGHVRVVGERGTRGTATLADSATLRFLTKYDLPITALRAQDESALNQLLESQLPPTVEQSLTSLSSLVEEQMAAVAAAVPQIDPTLEGAVKSTLGKMQHEVHALHSKVIQAAKRRDDTLRRQFQRAQALTFPQGHPQEREVGFVWFLNRYGPALVDRLMDELPLAMGHHWVLVI